MGTRTQGDIGNGTAKPMCSKRVSRKHTSWRTCYFHHKLKTFPIVYVDDFKLSGPAESIPNAWNIIRITSKIAPKGIDMDPPTPVGRYLGCDHHATEKWITWQDEAPTVLDPPPPKRPKGEKVDYAPAGLHGPAQAAAAGKLPVYCDRSYPVPMGRTYGYDMTPTLNVLDRRLNQGPRGTQSEGASHWTTIPGKKWMT